MNDDEVRKAILDTVRVASYIEPLDLFNRLYLVIRESDLKEELSKMLHERVLELTPERYLIIGIQDAINK